MPSDGKASGRERRRRVWRRRVQAWACSGRTQAEFCQQRGWPLTTFGWWKRRLNGAVRRGMRATGMGLEGLPEKAGGSRSAGQAFLPVQLVPRTPAEGIPWACEVGYPDGTWLRLQAVPAPELLRVLLCERGAR
jgi:hypothetical protein